MRTRLDVTPGDVSPPSGKQYGRTLASHNRRGNVRKGKEERKEAREEERKKGKSGKKGERKRGEGRRKRKGGEG